MQTITRKTLSANFVNTAKGFAAVITAESLDRDGEVLIPSGMNSTEYDRQPTLFWNHDYAKPVGRAVSIKRRDTDILGEFVFAERPDGYSGEFFPEVAAALVGQGIVTAVSIGYTPEAGGVRKASPVDKKRYGEEVVTVFSRWKLLEVSLAPLQSNPDALITAIRKGMISPVAAKQFFNVEVPRRVVVSVPVPCIKRANQPMEITAAVAREIAKARGQLYL